MFDDPDGPIEQFEWGRFVVCGAEHSGSHEQRVGAGKDIRLIGRDATRWREREGHRLTPSMIAGVYGKEIDVLIIGIGVNGAVECPQEVRQSIRANGIGELILERTPEACRTYNALFREGKSVALLAHGTC